MKLYEFKVIFTNGPIETVYASSAIEALIKACYSRITNAMDYAAESVYCNETKSFWTVNKEQFSASLTKRR